MFHDILHDNASRYVSRCASRYASRPWFTIMLHDFVSNHSRLDVDSQDSSPDYDPLAEIGGTGGAGAESPADEDTAAKPAADAAAKPDADAAATPDVDAAAKPPATPASPGRSMKRQFARPCNISSTANDCV